MIRHLNINKTWIIIGLFQIFTGINILMKDQVLDVSLPLYIGIFDDTPVGVLYMLVGVLMIINFVWDFYWYGIRVVLVIVSEMMFSLLFISFLLNDIIHSNLSFITGFSLIIALDILWQAYLEPPHKMTRGGSK